MDKILVEKQNLKTPLVEMCPGNFNDQWWSSVLHLTWETAAFTAISHPKTKVKQEKGIASSIGSLGTGGSGDNSRKQRRKGERRRQSVPVHMHTHTLWPLRPGCFLAP